ncbi:MAG: NAD-dependent deacylase [Bacteroidota bacterium]
MKKNIVVMTGAGISAESGIKTFRDADGLWEGHDVMEVASPEGWRKNQELVLDFYNQRRRQLKEVQPNAAHQSLVDLEEKFNVHIVTQNVDNLHEKAGSRQVVHLHGELTKVRSTLDERLVYDWPDDLHQGDTCEKGAQLRPHIVWFGEQVPMLERAATLTHDAEIILIIGTSMQVYPAAGLVGYALPGATIYYIDPKPAINYELSLRPNLKVVAEKATVGVPKVVAEILEGVEQR